MKKAGIIHRNIIRERGLDAMMIGNIHDELQLDVSIKDSEEVGKSGVDAIHMAAESLNCKVPFTGTYGIGLNWSETH